MTNSCEHQTICMKYIYVIMYTIIYITHGYVVIVLVAIYKVQILIGGRVIRVYTKTYVSIFQIVLCFI